MLNFNNHYFNTQRFIFMGFLVTLLSRLLPHPPNMTAMASFCLIMGAQYKFKTGLALTLLNFLLADFILSLMHGYPPLGNWTWFSLTAYIVILGIGKTRFYKEGKIITTCFVSTLFFWLWTNFGVWLTGHYYPFTGIGLLLCYTNAIPFLGLSLLGDFLWLNIFIYALDSKFISLAWKSA